jgi:hypothetical protein
MAALIDPPYNQSINPCVESAAPWAAVAHGEGVVCAEEEAGANSVEWRRVRV